MHRVVLAEVFERLHGILGLLGVEASDTQNVGDVATPFVRLDREKRDIECVGFLDQLGVAFVDALQEGVAPAIDLPLGAEQPVFVSEAVTAVVGTGGFLPAGVAGGVLPAAGVVGDARDL